MPKKYDCALNDVSLGVTTFPRRHTHGNPECAAPMIEAEKREFRLTQSVKEQGIQRISLLELSTYKASRLTAFLKIAM